MADAHETNAAGAIVARVLALPGATDADQGPVADPQPGTFRIEPNIHSSDGEIKNTTRSRRKWHVRREDAREIIEMRRAAGTIGAVPGVIDVA